MKATKVGDFDVEEFEKELSSESKKVSLQLVQVSGQVAFFVDKENKKSFFFGKFDFSSEKLRLVGKYDAKYAETQPYYKLWRQGGKTFLLYDSFVSKNKPFQIFFGE